MIQQQPYYAASSGAAPVVVQGTVVGANSSSQGIPASTYAGTGYVQQEEFNKGEAQPKRCNDVLFAILFYAHLGVMAWVAAKFVPIMTGEVANGYNDYDGGGRNLLGSVAVPRALSNLVRGKLGSDRDLEEEGNENGDGNNGGDGSEVSVADMMFVMGITGIIGFVISVFSLGFMMKFAKQLIKFALIFNIITSLLMGIAGALTGVIPLALMGFISFAISAYYAYVVWARIPFAASNLKAAVSAVQANFGLNFIAYSSLLFLIGWSLWWSVAFVSAMFVTSGCNAAGVCESEPNGVVVFLFLISYFWVHQVIKNTVHVTVAGTVGTWWFTPNEASSCCSSGVRDSFIRSITYSFGSICFGSLIVAIIQATREILRQMREQDDGILLCCAECLIGCLESLAEYFNKWAYVYVGLYGYSFMEAGRNVMTLFKNRGWTTIITDNLIDNVLFMLSIGVGLLTGLVAVLLSNMKGLGAEAAGGAFLVGLVIGFVLTSVLMGVVGSAVNTVIVCYAEAPNEFQQNHTDLSNDMRENWRQAWPVEFKY